MTDLTFKVAEFNVYSRKPSLQESIIPLLLTYAGSCGSPTLNAFLVSFGRLSR